MVVKLVSGELRNVYIAGAAVMGGAVILSLLWRFWVMCTRRNVHIERKAYFAYWFWGALFSAIMYLWLLWGCFDADRNGKSVNWTRWVFYIITMGVCGNGMIAEYQLQPHKWTRLYTFASLFVVFIMNIANAFADDGQARRMLGGISAVAAFIYFWQIFYFDGRFKDRWTSALVDIIIAALLIVDVAMFVVGHANQGVLSRSKEAIGYLAVECVLFFLIAPIMKFLWQAREFYIKGVQDPVHAAEYGCCGWWLCCAPVAVAAEVTSEVANTVGAVATAPLVVGTDAY